MPPHWAGEGGEGVKLEYIQVRVDAIRDLTGDYEAAHSAEDRLYLELLTAIADARIPLRDVRAAAAIALKTQRFDFERYCA